MPSPQNLQHCSGTYQHGFHKMDGEGRTSKENMGTFPDFLQREAPTTRCSYKPSSRRTLTNPNQKASSQNVDSKCRREASSRSVVTGYLRQFVIIKAHLRARTSERFTERIQKRACVQLYFLSYCWKSATNETKLQTYPSWNDSYAIFYERLSTKHHVRLTLRDTISDNNK